VVRPSSFLLHPDCAKRRRWRPRSSSGSSGPFASAFSTALHRAATSESVTPSFWRASCPVRRWPWADAKPHGEIAHREHVGATPGGREFVDLGGGHGGVGGSRPMPARARTAPVGADAAHRSRPARDLEYRGRRLARKGARPDPGGATTRHAACLRPWGLVNIV